MTTVLRKIDAAVVAERQRRFVENAEQQLPERVRSLFDLVKQDKRQFGIVRVRFVEIFLRQHRRGFAMAEVSRRRADQLRDLMRMLKLGAVDLYDRMRIAKQNFGSRFDDARFA